jgi:pilus assembly protein FimV
MNRSLKLSMLVALALGSSQVLALDLGQVRVKSALGQPLLAEIPLTPANPAELQSLSVQLASSEEFARAGIVGGRTAIPLHFSVVGAGSGHPVIRITSSVAVDNPYLDLLIEVNGKAGRTVREFAILLDPPGSQPAAAPVAPAPAAPSHTASRAAAPTTTAAPRPAVAAASRPAATRPASANGQYGPIQRGQTLSGIAHATAPAGVDVQQMLLALKQANPDAFYRDNINALKTGAVLRVPTAAEAQTMTIAAAMAEVRRENSDWRAGTPGKPTVVADAATRASASGTPDNTASESGDRLALVPAKEGHGAGSQGNGKGDKSAAALRQDLLRTQESLASLQQQSSDLKTRLKDLTDINSKNEHLLSLKDSEIAALQARLAAARKAGGLSPTPASSATAAAAAPLATATSSAPAQVQAGSVPAIAGTVAHANAAPAMAGSAASASAATTSPAVAPAPAVAKSPAAKPPVVAPKSAAAFEQPWYMQPLTWAAGAGAIVLLILLAMLGRRRKPAASASKSSLADRFGSEPSVEQDLVNGTDVDQEELLDQLAEHPDDIDLHLELVTLYYSRRDVEHFEAAAEAMHAHITDPQQDEWQDVVHMGEDLVPAHPLFDHHPEPQLPTYEENEAPREFDIDDYADDSDAPTVVSTLPVPPPAPRKVSEYSFNFDLSTPAGSEAAVDHAAASDETVVAPRKTEASNEAPSEAASDWDFNATENTSSLVDHNGNPDEFNDDPIDTKLDLARAYLDMGDADGARSMLGEVMKEGSQMQQDTARRLLENLH